jgi:asparagine synthetase B (glutamine-hydrolysing)
LKAEVEILTSTLSVRTGATRDVDFSNYVFSNMPATHKVAIQYGKVSAESTDAAEESACENARKAHFRGPYETTYQEGSKQDWLSTSSLYQRMMTMFGAVEAIGYLPGCFVPSESESTGTADEKRAKGLMDNC